MNPLRVCLFSPLNKQLFSQTRTVFQQNAFVTFSLNCSAELLSYCDVRDTTLRRLQSRRETWTRVTSCRSEQTDSTVVVEAAGEGRGQKWNISPKAGGQIQTWRREIQKAKTGQRSKQTSNKKKAKNEAKS